MDLSTRDGRRKQGEKIKAATLAAGLSIEELASRIGCSRALLYQYLSGASLAQNDRLQQIASLVGKPLSWFFVEEEGELPETVPESQVLRRERIRLRQIEQKLDAAQREMESSVRREQIQRLQELVKAWSSPPEWHRVIDTCRSLSLLLEQDGASMALAEALLQEGNALIRVNQWGSAKAALERAHDLFREINEPTRGLDCMQSLGHVNLMLGRAQEALEQFREVAGGTDWWNRWQGRLSQGAVYEVLGDYQAAIAHFEQAVEIANEREPSQDHELAMLYIQANWANVELDCGDFENASRRAHACARVAQSRADQEQYTEALLTSGFADLRLGYHGRGLAAVQHARDLAQLAGDQHRAAIALSFEALAELQRGRYQDAILAGKQALTSALGSGAARAERLAQYSLAEAYLACENAPEAEYHIEQGIALTRNQPSRLPIAEFWLLSSRLKLILGRWEEARELAQSALSTAVEIGARPLQIGALRVLGEGNLVANQLPESEEYAQQALFLARAVASRQEIWKSEALWARVQVRIGNTREARAGFTRALDYMRPNPVPNPEDADSLLEDREVTRVWRDWLLFLLSSEGAEAATMEARRTEWPPLEDWLARQIASPTTPNGDLNLIPDSCTNGPQ